MAARNDYIQIKKKLAASQSMHKNINNLPEPQIPQNPWIYYLSKD